MQSFYYCGGGKKSLVSIEKSQDPEFVISYGVVQWEWLVSLPVLHTAAIDGYQFSTAFYDYFIYLGNKLSQKRKLLRDNLAMMRYVRCSRCDPADSTFLKAFVFTFMN